MTSPPKRPGASTQAASEVLLVLRLLRSLIGWLFVCLFVWLVGWLFWLFGGCLLVCFACCLPACLPACLPCLALPCLALPCLALPCLALPCLALPCLALPCLALPACLLAGLLACLLACFFAWFLSVYDGLCPAHPEVDLPELQGATAEEIAKEKCKLAAEHVKASPSNRYFQLLKFLFHTPVGFKGNLWLLETLLFFPGVLTKWKASPTTPTPALGERRSWCGWLGLWWRTWGGLGFGWFGRGFPLEPPVFGEA